MLVLPQACTLPAGCHSVSIPQRPLSDALALLSAVSGFEPFEEEMRETKSQSGQDGVAYTYEELAEYYKGARPHQGSEVRGH